MANYEIVPGTTGAGVQSTKAGFIRRSMKKFLRLGNKKMRFFLIVPGAAVSETILVPNGRKGEIWPLNAGALDITLIAVVPTTSGVNTSYAIAEATQTWTGKHLIFAVEIGQ